MRPQGDKLSESEYAQKQYYNRIAEHYDQHYANPHALKYREEIYNRAFSGINLHGKIALDAMCGGGEATRYLISNGAKVTGLDISEECCRIYQNRYNNCTVECSSMLNSKLPDESFNLIVTDSLHHLHPNVSEGIDEVYRLLAPGGYFLCWEPTAGSFVDFARRLWYKLDKSYFEENEKAIDDRVIIKANSDRFEVVNKFYGGNLAYLFVNLSMVFRIPVWLTAFYAGALIAVETVLNRLQPRLFSCWVVCVFRKK